jgi:hypothetical protein
MPNDNQVALYSSVRHYLEAVARAGTNDTQTASNRLVAYGCCPTATYVAAICYVRFTSAPAVSFAHQQQTGTTRGLASPGAANEPLDREA